MLCQDFVRRIGGAGNFLVRKLSSSFDNCYLHHHSRYVLYILEFKMHLMYTTDASGKRVYTLKKVIDARVSKSAHPARFSPDDKYSRHRVTLKKRYGLLITQQKNKQVLGL